jgi:hemoglobin-like flavoprotein
MTFVRGLPVLFNAPWGFFGFGVPDKSSRRRALGRRHRDYNIHQADHENVLRVLLLTLAEFLGDDFSPEAARAWKSVYGKMAATMIEV